MRLLEFRPTTYIAYQAPGEARRKGRSIQFIIVLDERQTIHCGYRPLFQINQYNEAFLCQQVHLQVRDEFFTIGT